jgi:hypothetical protein
MCPAIDSWCFIFDQIKSNQAKPSQVKSNQISRYNLSIALDFISDPLVGRLRPARSSTFFQILLMVLFGRPKRRCRLTLGMNHSRVLGRFVLESFSRRRFLFRSMVIHTCSILSSIISSLTIWSGGVDAIEKGVKQLVVGYLGGVVIDHDGFGMTRVSGTHLIISGKFVVLCMTLSISYRCVDHSWNSLVRQFQSPYIPKKEMN